MKRALAVAALILLAACADGNSTSAADPPGGPSVDNVANVPDPAKACSLVFDGGPESLAERIPAALETVDSEVTPEQADEMLAIERTLSEALNVADIKLFTALTQVNDPFEQFADASESGRDDVSLDTSGVQGGITSAMQICTGPAYKTAG